MQIYLKKEKANKYANKQPNIVTLTNLYADILNVIRDNATNNYKNYVPVATEGTKSIKEIGAIIMDSPQLQDEFLSALVRCRGKNLCRFI